MNDHEVLERFREGLRKAISGCREMFAATHYGMWEKIAGELEKILHYGTKLSTSRAISEQELQHQADRIMGDKQRKSPEIVTGPGVG